VLVFDTNVLSELMRPAPNTAIASWVVKRATSTLHLTAVSEAELRYGLAIMPPGRRRGGLAQGLERMLRTGFANRILPFDSAAAAAYGEIAAARRAIGRPITRGRMPDRGHRPLARHGGGYAQRAGLRGRVHQCD